MGVIKVMALVNVATVIALLRPNEPGVSLLIVWFNLVALAACLIYARAANDEIAAEITAAEMGMQPSEVEPLQATLPFEPPRLALPAADPPPIDEPFVLKPVAVAPAEVPPQIVSPTAPLAAPPSPPPADTESTSSDSDLDAFPSEAEIQPTRRAG